MMHPLSASVTGSIEDLDTLEVLDLTLPIVNQTQRNLYYTMTITWKNDQKWLSVIVDVHQLTVLCSHGSKSASYTHHQTPYDFIKKYLLECTP